MWIINTISKIADKMIADRAATIFSSEIKRASDVSIRWSQLGQAMDICWKAGEMVSCIALVLDDKKQQKRLYDLYGDSAEMYEDLKNGLHGNSWDWDYNEEECPF